MKGGRYIGVVLLLLVAAMVFVPVISSEDSEAAPMSIDFTVLPNDDPIELKAGESHTFKILVKNNQPHSVLIDFIGPDMGGLERVSIVNVETLPSVPPWTPTEKPVYIVVTLETQKYAPTESGTITLKFYAANGTDVDTELIVPVKVSISSIYSAGGSYNHILGIWESPFDDAFITTLVSFGIWLIIAFIVSYLIFPTVVFLFINEKPEERRGIRRAIAKPFYTLIALFGLAQCARIYGLDESSVATLTMIVNVAYILLVALIVWGVYKAFIRLVFHKRAERMAMEEEKADKEKPESAFARDWHNNDRVAIQNSIVDESLIPLFDTIGKIFITVFAFASILASIGFDLMIIVTSAGVLGIAISLGAQSTLSQFFSGITLMINRPFVPGDIVRIGTSADIMRVKKVGLMITQFDDWNSNSTMTLPNNTVATSLITNITGKTSVYRVKIQVNIPYKEDVSKAMQLLRDAAMDHPRAITDGTYSLPDARIDSFEDSYIKIGVAVYVDDFEDYGSISAQIRAIIYRKFVENNIEIAFPQVDVNIKKDE